MRGRARGRRHARRPARPAGARRPGSARLGAAARAARSGRRCVACARRSLRPRAQAAIAEAGGAVAAGAFDAATRCGALQAAAGAGRPDVLEALLAAGAPVDAPDGNGLTALQARGAGGAGAPGFVVAVMVAFNVRAPACLRLAGLRGAESCAARARALAPGPCGSRAGRAGAPGRPGYPRARPRCICPGLPSRGHTCRAPRRADAGALRARAGGPQVRAVRRGGRAAARRRQGPGRRRTRRAGGRRPGPGPRQGPRRAAAAPGRPRGARCSRGCGGRRRWRARRARRGRPAARCAGQPCGAREGLLCSGCAAPRAALSLHAATVSRTMQHYHWLHCMPATAAACGRCGQGWQELGARCSLHPTAELCCAPQAAGAQQQPLPATGQLAATAQPLPDVTGTGRESGCIPSAGAAPTGWQLHAPSGQRRGSSCT